MLCKQDELKGQGNDLFPNIHSRITSLQTPELSISNSLLLLLSSHLLWAIFLTWKFHSSQLWCVSLRVLELLTVPFSAIFPLSAVWPFGARRAGVYGVYLFPSQLFLTTGWFAQRFEPRSRRCSVWKSSQGSERGLSPPRGVYPGWGLKQPPHVFTEMTSNIVWI